MQYRRDREKSERNHGNEHQKVQCDLGSRAEWKTTLIMAKQLKRKWKMKWKLCL